MMTILDAMLQTTDGSEPPNIVIPVAALNGETPVAGTISSDAVRALFGAQVDLPLPLTQAQYDALVATRPGQWEANWAWYLQNAVITVEGYVPPQPEPAPEP